MNLASLHSGEFYSLLCALFWSIAVILFRKSGETVPPVALNLFKNTVGFVLLIITMLITSTPPWPKTQSSNDWMILLASGALAIGVADSLFFVSLNRLGVGRSAIVDCLYSPFVILGSMVFLVEPMGLSVWLALLLMIAAILIGTWMPEPTDDPKLRRQIRMGIFLGILSMLFMAVGIVMAKPVLNRSDPIWATTVRCAGGFLFVAIQGLFPRFRKEVIKCFTPNASWKFSIPSALVGSYLAMIFWILGMKMTFTTVASILNQSSTIFALILATIFLNEKLTPRKVIAMLLGFGGVVVAYC